jgi:hypothetical protein
MMRSTPSVSIIGASTGRRKLAPTQKLRRKYSLGLIVSDAATAPKKLASALALVVIRR